MTTREPVDTTIDVQQWELPQGGQRDPFAEDAPEIPARWDEMLRAQQEEDRV